MTPWLSDRRPGLLGAAGRARRRSLPARSAAPPPPRPTARRRIGRRRPPSRTAGCPARAWRLLITTPSPFASVIASAKLWLPPVSSNGLNRTRPTRWTASRPLASSTADRADRSSTSRGDREDLVEVGVEHRLEAAAVGAARQAIEPSTEPADPAGLDDGDHDEDDDRDAEGDDGHPDVRCDGGVQVDRTVLRHGGEGRSAGRPSLASATCTRRSPRRRTAHGPVLSSARPATPLPRRPRQLDGETLANRRPSRPAETPPAHRPRDRTSTRPAGSVTPEEEARAAELEAQILAEEKAADEARKGRDRRAKAPARCRWRDLLVGAARAARRPGVRLRPARPAPDRRRRRRPADRARGHLRAAQRPERRLGRRRPARRSAATAPLPSRHALPALPRPTDRRPARAALQAAARAAAARGPDAARGRSTSSSARSTSSASADRCAAPSRAATSRRSCCGARPAPARRASPASSPRRSAPTSRRCRR